ncbi:MAG: hypothetical protein AAFX44_10515 [Pseudomonadota bacterium]
MTRLLAVALFVCAPLVVQAQVDKVTAYKDENGWKLQVNGEDYYVKGMVWSYSPRGQNYSYNLFGQSDDYIRKVLDYDFGLMKAAGINTIRSFTMLPPRWVEYVYREHGIMSVINPLMGRYGYNVGGKWIPFTDYSDPLTRETLKRDMQEFVLRYKDTPGVLMFAFGNESNYGLSWSSFEIENLPVGEQQTAKARFLYSLYEEVISAGKSVAPNQLFSIVNGDIQYIDLIAELVPSLDILGSNVYRGPTFTDLWARVDEKLDLPVVFFEFGSDAFNARTFQEDQLSQALILKDQWQEMYNKSYGNGEEGNSIGAFVFEWRDEWWKYLQVERLNIQDTNASWSNQAYLFDWAEGKNNMNEEWFGVVALGLPDSDGVYAARPRMAYHVLAEVFAMDPYGDGKSNINAAFANMDIDFLELKGDVDRLKAESFEDSRKLRFTGGRFLNEFALRSTEQELEEDGENGVEFSDGQQLFLDFEFQPSDNLDGQMTLNVLGNVARKRALEFNYGDRGLPLTIQAQTAPETVSGALSESDLTDTLITFNDRERVEIYDFEANYRGEAFDVNAFYHTPRFHWGFEGDFFGLVAEATDIPGIDVWDARAPVGAEIKGKGIFEGLTMVFGPEIFWGANPKFVVKYDFNLFNMAWTFIHSEDVSRLGQGANATEATIRETRQTTLYADKKFANGMRLELGGMISAPERIDEVFDRVDGTGNIFADEIDFEDTLSFKAKLSFPLFGAQAYVGAQHSGLVAESVVHHTTYGLIDPTGLPYSSLGNRMEYEAGAQIFRGNWMIFPRVLYRDNLVHANPNLDPQIVGGILQPGASARTRDDDPFAVLNNREARSAEIFFTYDPTGATPFYDWDNAWREDAGFAFNFGGTYTEFPTPTDSEQFFFEPAGANAPFGVGLPPEDVWRLRSRMVFNTANNTRMIFDVTRAFEQSTGDPNGGTRKYWDMSYRIIWGGGKHSLIGYYLQDAWGPYDFFRQFNVTFPEQFRFDYSYWLGGGFGGISDAISEQNATRIGIRTTFRTSDENSPDDEFLDGENDYTFLTVVYFNYQF